MFEDSLFATDPRRSPQRGWSAMMSFILQAALVILLIAVPLFYTEALPLDSIRGAIELPAPPPGRPPAPPPETARPRPSTSNLDQQGRLIAVREIPKSVARINEHAVPPPVGDTGDGVVGIPTGYGSPNGVIGSFLSDAARAAAAVRPAPAPSKPVQISHISEGLLIHKVTPEYPQIARISRQQGTVVLHAIIGRDGAIEQLQVVSGPPLLVRAAVEAVQQWRYRPYILNGQPVEVETQITVNFTLGG